MKLSFLRRSLVALSPLLFATAADAQLAYALANGGNSLVSFNLSSPGTIVSTVPLIGTLQGIDFRVSDSTLYGYSNSANAVVSIDPMTGITTLVATPSVASTSPLLGIDFNPVPSALRIVNADDQNLRVVLATGTTTADATFVYPAGDPNFGVSPTFTEAAYTNNDNDATTGTTIFYIDSALNTLATSTAPNTGPFTTVGTLGFTVDSSTGFDIYTENGVNTAYVNAGGFLHQINLTDGSTISSQALGGIGLSGLAIVPEPSSVLLLGAGAVGFLVRRRRSA